MEELTKELKQEPLQEKIATTKAKKKIYKKWWFWTIIIVSIVVVLSFVFGSSNYPNDLIDLPEAEYKAQCQVYAYDDIARHPNEYNKKLAKFTGEIIQIVRNGDKLQMRVNVTLKGEAPFSYYTDTMFVYYTITDNTNLLEQDIITMYGELRGTQEYTDVLNRQQSIPRIYVKFIDIVS